MGSAAEAEVGESILEEVDYPQPPPLIRTDNSTADKIMN